MRETRQSGREWYRQLRKPAWAPPPWLFGPVWAVLYIVIAVSYLHVFWLTAVGTVGLSVVLPFALNLLFNFAFTPLQFGLRNNLLALIDIVLLFITLGWAICAIAPYAPWVAIANVPYLVWVGFASVLQGSITWLNR